MMKRYLLAVALLLVPATAFSQATVIQGGSWTAGHVPAYGNSSGQPTVRDGGTAAGNATAGTNPSTMGITSRCTNPPCDGSVNSQGGPNGENFVIFDGPTADPEGYHYLGFSANIGGKAVITTGAGGGAAAQGLDFIIDGVTYNFPSDFPQIPVEVDEGGTGRQTLTQYNVLVGAGTSPVALVAPSATSGIPLVSQGSSANPAFGTTAIAGGGTGATTANDALNNLLPTQSMQNGKVLSTDGTNSSWVNIPGTGTVTSVTFDDGLTATINPCVAACTASLDINGLTVDGSPDGSADYLATYDASATANKKVLINTLPVLLSQLSTPSQAQGDVIYFNGTNWVRLGAGTNGYALLTQGAASNPVWGQYLINNLAIASQAQGDVVYFNGTNWTRLGAGTSGQYLQTQGTGANPQWATANSGMPGGYSNLVVTVTGNNTLTVTARATTASTAANAYLVINSPSVSCDLSASGLNGLDTGAEAANTWYAAYVISDGTNTGCLLSLSATTPTMPGSYTYRIRVGWVRNDGSSNLYRTIQKNQRAQYVVGTNPASALQMATGSAGNISTPTWVAVATGNYVPTTASRILGYIGLGNTGNTAVMVAPNNSYGAFNSSTNPPVASINSSNNANTTPFDLVLESTNIYWASATATGLVNVLGWVDNL